MSFINPEEMAFRDGRNVDANQRLRSSQPYVVYSNSNQYGLNQRDFVALNVGTGTSAHLPNEGAVELQTGGTASGAKTVRATRLNWRCPLGRSLIVSTTQTFGGAVAGVRRRIGFFDDEDGVFLEQTATDLRFVKRTSITGVVSDGQFAAQADWNIDRMDGTGPSGITLDISLRQTLVFDIQNSSGTSRIRCGFIIGGILFYCHEFKTGNVVLTLLSKTLHLPLHAEIENTEVAAAPAGMKINGSYIVLEGGDDEFARGYLNTGSTGTTSIAVTTRRPVLSIRAKATLNGLPNRGWVIPYDYSIRVSGNDAFYEIIVGGTLTGPAWTSAATDSAGEYDVSATAIAGGVRVISGFGVTQQGNFSTIGQSNLIDRFPTSVDYLTGGQTTYTIVATSFSGVANVSAAINWREIY